MCSVPAPYIPSLTSHTREPQVLLTVGLIFFPPNPFSSSVSLHCGLLVMRVVLSEPWPYKQEKCRSESLYRKCWFSCRVCSVNLLSRSVNLSRCLCFCWQNMLIFMFWIMMQLPRTHVNRRAANFLTLSCRCWHNSGLQDIFYVLPRHIYDPYAPSFFCLASELSSLCCRDANSGRTIKR